MCTIIIIIIFEPVVVMFVSMLHPWRIKSVLSMWVLIAFFTVSMAPSFPAFTLLSSVMLYAFLEKECVLVTVCSHISECPTATFAHIWVIHVSCHYFHNNFNSSFLSCNNFVLIYYTKIEKRLNICVYEFCVCLPFMVMFLRAPQPLLHTPALFMWMLVTLTMMVIAFFCLAITWFSSVQEAVFYIACL